MGKTLAINSDHSFTLGEARGQPTPVRASEELANKLTNQIASGMLEAGRWLPTERELAHHHKVSRAVVREAITMLTSRGLLTTRRGYRPIVRRPDLDTAVNALGLSLLHMTAQQTSVWYLFESRILMEGTLARYAATSSKRADIEALRDALEFNFRSIGDSESFDTSNNVFHECLYNAPENPIYPILHRAYIAWLSTHWRKMIRSREMDKVHYAGHLSIYEAIVARDPDGAERALRRHLETAWEFVRSSIFDSCETTIAAADPVESICTQ
jgi:GntR family transcriptional regulator, sialic acid-inducible nan operon repressor